MMMMMMVVVVMMVMVMVRMRSGICGVDEGLLNLYCLHGYMKPKVHPNNC
jgi:hypothetical protein